MFQPPPSTLRIGIYGNDVAHPGRNVGLWPSGFQGALGAAGATPVVLAQATGDQPWHEILQGLGGVVVSGFGPTDARQGDAESLCLWCERHRFPLLAIDHGLLALNAAFGGTSYQDLPRELPEALQHRHPPEPGLRHAIMVQPGTVLCNIYGEGEIVVNSEHRKAIQRVARGFQVCATALDGVIEAIEPLASDWFGMGVQWQPASASASGLDIQVFRGLIEAALQGQIKPMRKPQKMAVAV